MRVLEFFVFSFPLVKGHFEFSVSRLLVLDGFLQILLVEWVSNEADTFDLISQGLSVDIGLGSLKLIHLCLDVSEGELSFSVFDLVSVDSVHVVSDNTEDDNGADRNGKSGKLVLASPACAVILKDSLRSWEWVVDDSVDAVLWNQEGKSVSITIIAAVVSGGTIPSVIGEHAKAVVADINRLTWWVVSDGEKE